MSEEYLDLPIPQDAGTGDQYELVITTTITVEQTVPLTRQYYPDETTIGDALNFERNQPLTEKLESFTENMSNVPEDKINFGERISVQRVQRKAEEVKTPSVRYSSPSRSVTITGDRRGIQIGDFNSQQNFFG